jgi:hypothetical protein
MKSQPTNLTQLAKTRGGKYPANTVAEVQKRWQRQPNARVG